MWRYRLEGNCISASLFKAIREVEAIMLWVASCKIFASATMRLLIGTVGIPDIALSQDSGTIGKSPSARSFRRSRGPSSAQLTAHTKTTRMVIGRNDLYTMSARWSRKAYCSRLIQNHNDAGLMLVCCARYGIRAVFLSILGVPVVVQNTNRKSSSQFTV